jgi:hypothetical protein
MNKSELLLNTLEKFYAVPEHAQTLLDILNRKNKISLRSLEWFVTNYSKQNQVSYVTPAGRPFTVHVAYKSSLDGYSKRLFDPFCRTERIDFKVGDEKITTTVAQLNFIRWCIQNDIVGAIKRVC